MSYYRGAFAAVICYDCSSHISLVNAEQWIKDFKEKSAAGKPILLVACKKDLLDKE